MCLRDALAARADSFARGRGGLLLVALLAAAFIVTLPAVASAQARARAGAGARAQDAEARALFEEGRAHADAERWIEALDAFRRSRAVSPRPATIFNIATTLIRLGRAQEALTTIGELEAVADPTQHARILQDAAEIRRQAEGLLRHVTLRVSPDAATIEIDGQIVAGEGAERTMTLDPGAHAVVVSADGHTTERFSLEPGQDQREVTLTELDGTLHIVPSVDTASVSVDGTVRGTGAQELSLRPGSHAVGILADGYLPFDRTVDLLAGATLTIDASLELIPEDADITHSPVFWGLIGGGAALVLVGILVPVICASVSGGCYTGEQSPYGGTTDTVIAPLSW